MAATRDLDLVLFGATGFTGRLTAEYLARHAPASLRWAIAGRDAPRLEALRTHLAGIAPGCAELELVHASVDEPASIEALAVRAHLVITTVGPYLRYGEPLVAACARNGTDYVDLAAESEFVDRMYVAHHAAAQASGARIVHACGFESVPPDLGALFTIKELAPTGPVSLRGVVRTEGMISGGTFHTVMNALSRARGTRGASRQRLQVEGRPHGRSSRAVPGRPFRDRDLDLWALPLPSIDPQVVARSGAALEAYGPRFRYSHYAGFRSLPYAVGATAGVAGLFLAAHVPLVRDRLLARVPAGEGPDQARRERSWFSIDLIGESEGRTVHARVSGGDPGYAETAKMLAEAALCLNLDDNPKLSGQLTTAVAMGDRLIARLRAAGLVFEVVSRVAP